MRFLNPAEKSPESEPETIPTSKKRTPKINKRTVRTRTPVKTDEFVEFVKNHTQNSKEKQEKEKKNKSEHKTTKKKGKRKQRSKNVSSSSEYDSSDTDFSDHDLITGLISSTEQQSNPTKKRSSFRKSGKIRESLADSASDDSDHDDDVPNDDGDDDDYNVEKDCNDLLKQSRITQWSLKRKKRSSLDETPDTPSNSQQIAKSSPSLQNTVDCSNQSPIPVESRDRSGISSEDSTSVNLTSDNDIETNSPKQKKLKLQTPISVPTANESKEIKVQENEMVALKPDQVWLDRPLVGRIVSVRNDELEVIWYFGGYTTKWREWSLAEGDKVKVQRDTVSRERVLMESFQLTSSKKIPAKTAKQLRSMYKVLDKK